MSNGNKPTGRQTLGAILWAFGLFLIVWGATTIHLGLGMMTAGAAICLTVKALQLLN